jgi:hypothetical protein
MSLAPCRPRSPLSCCSNCDRLADHLPHDPEQRPRTVLMDVTTILREGQGCPMFVAKVERRDWWLQRREEVAA